MSDRAAIAPRRGAVLIVVAGVASLLAALALAFLARMRADGEEMQRALRVGQARIMLIAACTYVQEASRIGWDDPATPEHEECFGWLDVRDGTPGPKPTADFTAGARGDDSRFPVGAARRFPMYVMRRPPFATRLTVAYNPIRTSETAPPATPADPAYGRAWLRDPDPQPVVDNGWAVGAVDDANWPAYARGDTRPRPGSAGQAWFRLRRETASRFVVTCGAGGTLGFRGWSEVQADGAEATFGDDPAAFADLRAREVRLWYLIEWTGAVGLPDMHILDNDLITEVDNFQWGCTNSSQKLGVGWGRTHGHGRDFGGTIRWVQRLLDEPTNW